MIHTKLLSIDAWREEGSWVWNNWFQLEDDIYLNESILNSPRKLLTYCREKEWLSEHSKGHLTIEDDGYNVVICNRKTYQPILAFCYGEYLN